MIDFNCLTREMMILCFHQWFYDYLTSSVPEAQMTQTLSSQEYLPTDFIISMVWHFNFKGNFVKDRLEQCCCFFYDHMCFFLNDSTNYRYLNSIFFSSCILFVCFALFCFVLFFKSNKSGHTAFFRRFR